MAFSTILSARSGYTSVREARSLDEALEILADDKDIEFALIDLVMPGMQNAASVTAIRDCFPHIKVAILSGSCRREDIFLALASGAHGYILKDSGISDIVKAISLIRDGNIFVPNIIADVRPPSPDDSRPANISLTTSITPRQKDVLRLLSVGRSNKEIARLLSISEGTVKLHVAALFRMLNVKNRSSAAVAANKLLQGV